MANHGSAAVTRSRGSHSQDKTSHKKEAAAAPPSNVVEFPAWHIPVPALTDGSALGCACDIVAIGGNVAGAVFDAEFDYEKEVAEFGIDLFASLQTSLDEMGKTAESPPETADAMIMRQTAKALERFEACHAMNLRLARRLWDANLAALEAMATVPRHFFGMMR